MCPLLTQLDSDAGEIERQQRKVALSIADYGVRTCQNYGDIYRISKQRSLDLRKFAADHLSYRFSKRSRRVWLLDSFHGFGYGNTGVDEAGIMATAHCQSSSCLIALDIS